MAVPPPSLGGFAFDDPRRFYYIAAALVVLLGLAMANGRVRCSST